MDIEKYKKTIIHISTKFGKTIGFYLDSENIIVTKSQIISGTREAFVLDNMGKEQMANVLYIDEIYGIAFLEVVENKHFEGVKLFNRNIENGHEIIAIQKNASLELEVNSGLIVKAENLINNIKYAQTDIEIGLNNNNTVIFFNNKNEVLGLNANILSSEESLDLILPVNYLIEAIEEYRKYDGEFVIKCNYCHNLLTINDVNNDYCSYCGEEIKKELVIGDSETLFFLEKKLEEIVVSLRPKAKLLSVAENLWTIKDKSSKIKINYNPSTKYIVLYSTLCNLPQENIGKFYEFLLSENSKLKNVAFSVNQKNVILSTMYIFFDNDMQVDVGYEVFRNLFEMSDYYENVLIEMGGKQI